MKPGIRNIDRVQKALEAAEMLSAQQKSNLYVISTLPNERHERLTNLKQRVLRTDTMKGFDSVQNSQNSQGQIGQKNGISWDIFKIQQPLLAFKQSERAYEQQFQNKILQTRSLFKSTKEKRNTEQNQLAPQPIKQANKLNPFDPGFINQTNSIIINNQSKQQNSQSLFSNPIHSTFNTDQKSVHQNQGLNNSLFNNSISSLFSNNQEQKKQQTKDTSAQQHPIQKNEQPNLPQKTSESLVTSKGFVPGLFNSNPNSSLFSQTMPRMQENTNFQPIKPNSGLFSEGNPINEIKTEKCFNIFGNNSNAQLNKKEQKVSEVQQKETQKSIFDNQKNTLGNLFGGQTDQNKSSIFQPKTPSFIPEPQKPAEVTNIFGNPLKTPELSQSNMFVGGVIGGNLFSKAEKKQIPVQNKTSLFHSNKPSDSSNETPKFNMFDTKKEQKPSIFAQSALNQQNQTGKNSSLFSSFSPNEVKPNLPSLFNFSSQQQKPSQQKAPAKQINLFSGNSFPQDQKTQQADKKNNLFLSDLSKKPLGNSQNNEIKASTSIFGNPKPAEIKQPENNDVSQKSVTKKNPTEMFGDFFKSKGQTGNIFTKDQPNQPGNIFAQISNQSSSLQGNIFGNQSNMFMNKNSVGAVGLFSGPVETGQKELKKEDEDEEEGDGEDDGILEDKSEIDPNLSTGNYKYEETEVAYRQTLPKLKKGSNNLVEGVIVSIQKFKNANYYNLNVRLANKIIYFTGTIIPGASVISKINENQYKNLLLRGIAWVNPEGKTAGQIFKLQFKDEKQGLLFYDKFNSVCKKVQ